MCHRRSEIVSGIEKWKWFVEMFSNGKQPTDVDDDDFVRIVCLCVCVYGYAGKAKPAGEYYVYGHAVWSRHTIQQHTHTHPKTRHNMYVRCRAASISRTQFQFSFRFSSKCVKTTKKKQFNFLWAILTFDEFRFYYILFCFFFLFWRSVWFDS